MLCLKNDLYSIDIGATFFEFLNEPIFKNQSLQGYRSLRGRGASRPPPPQKKIFSGPYLFYPQKLSLQGQLQGFAPLVFPSSRCCPPSFSELPTPLLCQSTFQLHLS